MPYIYQGYVQVQQLIEPTVKQNLILKAVVEAILLNRVPTLSVSNAVGSIPIHIQHAYLYNFNSFIQDYYRYGRYKHPDGLPKVYQVGGKNSAASSSDRAYVLATNAVMVPIIEADLGFPIRMLEYAYGYPTSHFYISLFMVKSASFLPAIVYREAPNADDYDYEGDDDFYDTPEGALRTIDFWDVAAAKFRRITSTGDLLGTTINFVTIDIEYVEYTYLCGPYNDDQCISQSWKGTRGSDGNYIETYYSIDISTELPHNDTTVLHQVLYTDLATEAYAYWVYDQIDNLYPDIHQDPPPTSELEGTYPFAILIEDGLQVFDNGLGVEYKDKTVALLDKIGIDLEEFMEGMVDPNDQENLKSVVDCFILLAPSLGKADDHASLSYFYEFFRQHYHVNMNSTYPRTQAKHLAWLGGNGFLQHIGYYYRTNRTAFHIQYLYSTMRVLNGNVSSPTIYDKATIVSDLLTEPDPNSKGGFSTINGVKTGVITQQIYLYTTTDQTNESGWNDHVFVLRKQLTETTYVELAIVGLQHISTVTKHASANISFTEGVLANLEHVDTGQFYFPLDIAIVNSFNRLRRSNIQMASLNFVVQVLSFSKLPWWANESFLKFIAVILYVWSNGTSETWTALLYSAIESYLIGQLITVAINVLIDLVGTKNTILIAAIAAAYAYSKGAGDKELFFDLITAEQLLQGVTYALAAISNTIGDAILEVLEDIQDSKAAYEEEVENLEDIELYLANIGVEINLIDIVSPAIYSNFNEEPTEFYNRCVHNNNPGVLCLDAIDTYVENLLRLPDVSFDAFNLNYDITEATLI